MALAVLAIGSSVFLVGPSRASGARTASDGTRHARARSRLEEQIFYATLYRMAIAGAWAELGFCWEEEKNSKNIFEGK